VDLESKVNGFAYIFYES